MFEEFEMTLPAVTELLFSIPPGTFWVYSILVVLFLMAMRTQAPAWTCIGFERMFCVFGGLILVFATIAIFLPVLKMFGKVGGT